jgi:hypothetical protein
MSCLCRCSCALLCSYGVGLVFGCRSALHDSQGMKDSHHLTVSDEGAASPAHGVATATVSATGPHSAAPRCDAMRRRSRQQPLPDSLSSSCIALLLAGTVAPGSLAVANSCCVLWLIIIIFIQLHAFLVLQYGVDYNLKLCMNGSSWPRLVGNTSTATVVVLLL